MNLTGNYSLNRLDRRHLPADFQTFFNTPTHKYNLGLSGAATQKVTYSLTYRWAQGHRQERPWASGTIRPHSSTNIYVGDALPKLATTFQAMAPNLFNTNNIQIIGGPQLGRLACLGGLVSTK